MATRSTGCRTKCSGLTGPDFIYVLFTPPTPIWNSSNVVWSNNKPMKPNCAFVLSLRSLFRSLLVSMWVFSGLHLLWVVFEYFYIVPNMRQYCILTLSNVLFMGIHCMWCPVKIVLFCYCMIKNSAWCILKVRPVYLLVSNICLNCIQVCCNGGC